MARPRLALVLAAAVVALPAGLIVASDEAEASHDRYNIVTTFEWGGTFGSRMVTCNVPGDFAISHRILEKTGPAKIRSATFYSERTGNYTHPEGLSGWEGMIVEWRDGRNKPGSVTVQLTCEPD